MKTFFKTVVLFFLVPAFIWTLRTIKGETYNNEGNCSCNVYNYYKELLILPQERKKCILWDRYTKEQMAK